MKSYEEVTRDVLERSAELLAQQQKRRKTRRQILLPVIAICLVTLAAVGIWQRSHKPTALAEGVGAADSRSAEKSATDTAFAISQAGSAAADNGVQDATAPSAKTQSPTAKTQSPTAKTQSPTAKTGESKPGKTTSAVEANTKTAQSGSMTTTRTNMIVDQYDGGGVGCYAMPKQGEHFCSLPLTEAMKHYGDSVDYRIAVHLFYHETAVTDAAQIKQEAERLASLGYTVQQTDAGITIVTRLSKIQNFPAAQQYGYMLFLANEPDAKR